MFCLNYYPYQKYLDQVGELKIFYNPKDTTLKDFLEHYQEKSIVIDVTEHFEELDAKLFKEFNALYGNFKLIIDYNDDDALNMVKEYELPFFFSNFATSIDKIVGYMKYQPTDMYICEEMGFHLDKISKLLHDNNIKVRVFPNICQSSFPENADIKSFFIRPDDITIYSQFVDVFELISDEPRQETLLKIYTNEKWFGKLNEIIPSLHSEIDNKYLHSEFCIPRIGCGKRCMYDPSSCSICNKFLDLADTFEENGIARVSNKVDKI